jgi:hypothetical protein
MDRVSKKLKDAGTLFYLTTHIHPSLSPFCITTDSTLPTCCESGSSVLHIMLVFLLSTLQRVLEMHAEAMQVNYVDRK